MRRKLEDVIREGVSLAERVRSIQLDEEQGRGVSAVKRAIEQRDIAVGVGPPGTGKTLVFSKSMAEEYSKLGKGEVMVYVAPTNQLVLEAAARTIAYLKNMGYGEQELMRAIRVFGSRFESPPCDEHTKMVFTTGYQPGSLRALARLSKSVHLLVDEASTTALHEVFMPLAYYISQRLAEGGDLELLGSLSVIGDPMQAIVDPSYGRSWKYEQLMVTRLIMIQIPESERKVAWESPPEMFRLAQKYGGSSRYFFLDTTHRMPKPTETLVSVPFYDRLLKAKRDYREAMRGIASGYQPYNLVSESHLLRYYVGALDNAIDSQYPIVYIKHEGKPYSPYRGLDEYDEKRAILGAEVASYLALRTSLRRITVITSYNEMALQIRHYISIRFKRILGDEGGRIHARTIHSSIGLDSEAVVVVMGKEYRGKQQGMDTIYFQSPELVNVQFSRHITLLVIIGNIERLSRNMSKAGETGERYAFMRRIGEGLQEALKELRAQGAILIREIG